MRLFYKFTDEDDVEHIAEVMEGGTQKNRPLSDVEALVDSGEALLYDTHDELNETIQYKTDRSNEYPSIQDQLDLLYHEIIVSGSLTSSGSWAQSIKAVKDAHPKP